MPTKTGCIYKIENTINHKIYIGQTTTAISRWKEHYAIGRRGKSKYELYRDMYTMGITVFTFQILEDDIPIEELDDKEREYIKKFNSDTNGYNITSGGNHTSTKGKLTLDIVLDIRNDIQNQIPFKQIAETYGIDISTISDINNGDTWHDTTITYPIIESRNKKKHFSDDEIRDIYDRLANHQTASSIAKLYKTSTTTITKINHGKIYSQPGTQYPICQPRTSPKNLDKDTVLAIAKDLATTTEAYVSLSRKYCAGRKTLKGINDGTLYTRHLTENGHNNFPLRK